MAFDSDEKDHLSLIVETAMNRAMKPIQEELTQHSLTIQKIDQTLYGETGENGLRKNVKDVTEDVEMLKTERIRIIAYVTAASGTIVTVGTLFGEKVKKMLGL